MRVLFIGGTGSISAAVSRQAIATDVAQVYVGAMQTKVPRPEKGLKGFVKVSLHPGETRKVSVMLDRRALSYYDVNAKQMAGGARRFQSARGPLVRAD